MPALNSYEMLTPRGRRELILRRHPGLWLNGEGLFYSWGEAIVQEEIAKERRQDMMDMIDLLPAGNEAGKRTSRALKAKVNKPSNEWVDVGGSWAERKR